MPRPGDRRDRRRRVGWTPALARGLLLQITTMLDTEPSGGTGVPPDRFPVGILAALLAVGIAVGAGGLARVIVRRTARRDAHRVAADSAAVKFQSLALQRAAVEDEHLLPVYGSSELYCCGDPYRATQVFAGEPTGFDAFAVGQAGVANLLFMQMFGALGTSLRGKRLVIVGSPPWYNAGTSYREN